MNLQLIKEAHEHLSYAMVDYSGHSYITLTRAKYASGGLHTIAIREVSYNQITWC